MPNPFYVCTCYKMSFSPESIYAHHIAVSANRKVVVISQQFVSVEIHYLCLAHWTPAFLWVQASESSCMNVASFPGSPHKRRKAGRGLGMKLVWMHTATKQLHSESLGEHVKITAKYACLSSLQQSPMDIVLKIMVSLGVVLLPINHCS